MSTKPTKPTPQRGRPAGSGEGYVRVNLTITQEQRDWLASHPNASEVARDVFASAMVRKKRTKIG